MKFRDYNKYDVYEDGRIYSYKSKKFLKPGTSTSGYQIVSLSNNEGEIKKYQLHRVVYETFSGEPIPEGLQVNHIDECKTNNHINNLNLMTCKENINWGSANERRSKKVGAFKYGNLVFTFQSTQDAGRQGFTQSSVAACCRGERKKHKGFEWRYL